MSRIGRKLVVVPPGVSVNSRAGSVAVTGPRGSLELKLPDGILLERGSGATDSWLVIDVGAGGAKHGLVRALFNNMVSGCAKDFERRLEIQGVGYQAALKADVLSLQVGFSKPVLLKVPSTIKVVLSDPTHVTIAGCDRQLVGQFAAQIRSIRPPEPYKGKGIRYQGEQVRRKSGKAFGAK